eukprot:gene1653-12778_t
MRKYSTKIVKGTNNFQSEIFDHLKTLKKQSNGTVNNYRTSDLNFKGLYFPKMNTTKTPNMKKIDNFDKREILYHPENEEIPKLKHNLESVIEDRGLHLMEHHGKLQFNSFLKDIIQPSELKIQSQYIIPSEDLKLKELANNENISYRSSTSSMSSILSLLFLQLSNHKPTNSYLMDSFRNFNSNFVRSILKPSMITLTPSDNDELFSIDAYKPPLGNIEPTILSNLGITLERMLCMDENEFTSKYIDSNNMIDLDQFCYTKIGKFLIRAQLDCYSDKINGKKKTFDIKTRAIQMIRRNVHNYELFSNQTLNSILGINSSYEREFYDLIRSAFIKYSLQAKMGNMDGIFLAYHNTKNILGFEYLSCEIIDYYVFGNSIISEKCFEMSLSLLQNAFDELINKFERKKLRILFNSHQVRNSTDV